LRDVYFPDGWKKVPVYERALLGSGDSFAGPAIVTQLDATTMVPPGWQGSVHPTGAILLASR
jgi:N-methylhydantoinase A